MAYSMRGGIGTVSKEAAGGVRASSRRASVIEFRVGVGHEGRRRWRSDACGSRKSAPRPLLSPSMVLYPFRNREVPLNIVVFLVEGLAAGVLSGLFGIGGGVLIVPALVFFLGLTVHAAVGTSLGALLLPVGF